jgi:6-phosphogluconolactonase (cycloisomerase 2 family)
MPGSVEVFRISNPGQVVTRIGTFATGESPEAIIADAANRLLYVANYSDSSISSFRINPDYSLTLLATTAAGLMRNPKALALSDNGDRLFIGNRAPGQRATSFTRDPVTGLLSQPVFFDSAETSLVRDVIYVPGTNRLITANFAAATLGQIILTGINAGVVPNDAPTGSTPVALALTRDQKFLLVAGDGIAVHTMGNDGAVGAIVGAPTAAGSTPVDVFLSPDERFAYVINFVGNTVSTMSFDSTTGALALLGQTIVGTTPYGGAIDPKGDYLVVPNSVSNDVFWFARDATTGGLTPLDRRTICTDGITAAALVDIP